MKDRKQMQAETGILRGARAIMEHVNGRMAGGRPYSRGAIYRLISEGKLPVRRLGPKGTELISTAEAVDAALGLSDQPANDR
jgi:hypothetical protein